MADLFSDGGASSYQDEDADSATQTQPATQDDFDDDDLGLPQVVHGKRARAIISYANETQEAPSSPAFVDPPEWTAYYDACQATDHKPNPPATRENTFRSQRQAAMLEAFDTRSRSTLADHILDDGEAPSTRASRLAGKSTGDVSFLLMQLEDEVLRAILCNTFDTEAKASSWTLHDPKTKALEGFDCDPGIYVNVFAPLAGGGLSREQAKQFVLTLWALSGDLSMSDPRLVRHGVKAGYGVRYQYKKLTGSELTPDQRMKNKKDLEFLAKVWSRRVEEAPDTVKHFCVCIEGGWTIEILKRLLAHWDGRSTPKLFLIVRSILLHLFPELHFTLRQYVIFRPFREQDAAVGESIVHQMFSTYLKAGGCNVTQAGISIASANKITDELVEAMEEGAMKTGLMQLMQANAEDEKARLDALREEVIKDILGPCRERLETGKETLQDLESALDEDDDSWKDVDAQSFREVLREKGFVRD